MHTAEINPEVLGDLGAGYNLIQSLFTNWMLEAVRKTMEETGILRKQKYPHLGEEDNNSSFPGDSFQREPSVEEVDETNSEAMRGHYLVNLGAEQTYVENSYASRRIKM